MAAILFLLLILIVFAVVSVQLAYSDYLPGRTRMGWGLLACYLAGYFTFAVLLLGKVSDPRAYPLIIILFGLLLGTQAPLLATLISYAAIGDPSRGLKILKDYSLAEKKVVEDDLAGAITEYEKIIGEDPDDKPARFRLAELYCENGEYHKAAKAYETLLKEANRLSVNEHCSALTRLAEIYEKQLYDIENARRCMRAIIEAYPGTKYAGYAIEHLDNL